MTARPVGAWRAVRVLTAVVLTTFAALHVVTLLLLLRGHGPREYAMSFFLTGTLALVLSAASVVAWRWVGRAGRERGGTPPLEGVVEDPTTRPHAGLGGEVEPPTRW